jgi:hypothetical protein
LGRLLDERPAWSYYPETARQRWRTQKMSITLGSGLLPSYRPRVTGDQNRSERVDPFAANELRLRTVEALTRGIELRLLQLAKWHPGDLARLLGGEP